MTPIMGGSGTSPNACMQMTWKACPAGRRGMGTVHMLTASAQNIPLGTKKHQYLLFCNNHLPAASTDSASGMCFVEIANAAGPWMHFLAINPY